jgi:hypothetical protein
VNLCSLHAPREDSGAKLRPASPINLHVGIRRFLLPHFITRRGREKMEESFGNAGVLADCRSFVSNENTIHQDRGIDSRLGQPSYKDSQPRSAMATLPEGEE